MKPGEQGEDLLTASDLKKLPDRCVYVNVFLSMSTHGILSRATPFRTHIVYFSSPSQNNRSWGARVWFRRADVAAGAAALRRCAVGEASWFELMREKQMCYGFVG